MPTLTTADGEEYTFNAASLAVLMDHDPATGAMVTTVWGITRGSLAIREAPEAFVQRLGIAADFARLTRPDGYPVWIRGTSVSSLRAPLPGEYRPGVRTVVVTGPLTLGVEETPEAAARALNAHGGKL